jgi:hypothetical protein
VIVLSHRGAQLLRPVLLLLAGSALAWSAVIAVSGGIIFDTSWGRVSSRNPINPFVVGALALMCYVFAFRTRAEADVRSVSSLVAPRTLAALLVAVALAVGIHWGTFVASGSDASGYVSQARLWLRGDLTTLAPEWARDAPWQDATWSSAPLGYRPGKIPDVLVPTYSPGLPLMMAMFEVVGGSDALYYVVPCLGAIAVWMTYLLGARFAGSWAGFVAALLMLTSPTFLVMLVQPMSDIPAAALWSVALWAASRGGTLSAAGAGAAVAAAIVTRPNLAPLAGIIAVLALVTSSRRVRDLLYFAAAAAPGPIAIALLNAHLYGSPFQSGYGSLEVLYSFDRVWPNLAAYTRWLITAETPLMLLGIAAPYIVANERTDRRLMSIIAVVFPAAVLALYLPYFVFEVWLYLRFLLPAYPPLLAATGAVVVTLLVRARHPAPAVATAVVVVAAVAVHGLRHSNAFALRNDERRFTQVAEYVGELPPGSVFVSLLHSGSIRYYAGRDVLRWELVDAASMDAAVAHIRKRGHDVYFVGDRQEEFDFKKRFATSETARELERAALVVIGGTRVYTLADLPVPRP